MTSWQMQSPALGAQLLLSASYKSTDGALQHHNASAPSTDLLNTSGPGYLGNSSALDDSYNAIPGPTMGPSQSILFQQTAGGPSRGPAGSLQITCNVHQAGPVSQFDHPYNPYEAMYAPIQERGHAFRGRPQTAAKNAALLTRPAKRSIQSAKVRTASSRYGKAHKYRDGQHIAKAIDIKGIHESMKELKEFLGPPSQLAHPLGPLSL